MARFAWNPLALLPALSLLAGCGPAPVLTQSIPVASSPLGASVYADGQFAGRTPLSLDLTRNRDHLVTLVQPGYRQANMLVERQYLQNDVMMRSMQAGFNTGSFFNNPGMGMNAAFNSVQQDKDSGAAYQLIPPALSIAMLPAGAPNPPAPYAVPPYAGAPIYPYPPSPAQDQSAAGAAAVGAAVGAMAGSGIKPYNHENDRSRTTSTTTSRSYIGPNGAAITDSTTKSNSSGSSFGYGFGGASGGPASEAAGPPAGSAPPSPDFGPPPVPSMPGAAMPGAAMPGMAPPQMP